MTETYLSEYSPEERIAILHDGADKVEQTTYMQALTPEELDAKREELAEKSIKVSDLNDELDEIKSEFKGRIKPLKDEVKHLLGEIKTKQTEKSGVVYHMANHESGMMESYDEKGEFISMRRLRPEEKQGNIFVTK